MTVLGKNWVLNLRYWFRDPQNALPYAEPRRLTYFASKSVRASPLKIAESLYAEGLKITHAQGRNPSTDMDKFGIMVDVPDIVTNFGDYWWRGFWVAGGQISPFPIDFYRRPYSTLALPCECVISGCDVRYPETCIYIANSNWTKPHYWRVIYFVIFGMRRKQRYCNKVYILMNLVRLNLLIVVKYSTRKLQKFMISRPEKSHFFAIPDKIGNKLISANCYTNCIVMYIWRVPHYEVRGKWSYLICSGCFTGVSDNSGSYCKLWNSSAKTWNFGVIPLIV